MADLQEEDPELPNLFMELASGTRFSILMSLSRKPTRLSSLSRELDTTAQDIFRNLNRMAKEGLVRKADGEFFITEYGMMVVKQFAYFAFMRKHREFFETHSITKSGVPDEFLLRLGELAAGEPIESVTAVFQRLKKIESSATASLKAMVPQAWPEEGVIFIDRASQGVQVQTIAGHNTIIPRDVVDSLGDKFNKLIRAGFFTTKMVEKIGVGIYVADGAHAALMFPRTTGEVDMTMLFVSQDSAFCRWCSDLFDHFWQKAKRFDLEKARVVD